jgi:hypothetical protein
MKKRTLTLFVLTIAVLALTAVGEEKPLTLKNTSWKLVGFVDVRTNELEPADYSIYWGGYTCPCPTANFPYLSTDDWFTLVFQPSRTDFIDTVNYQWYSGKLTNELIGDAYVVDYAQSIIDFGPAVIGWACDESTPTGNRYYRALRDSHTFELSETSLKIYYNNNLEYLLLEPWEPAPSKVQDAARIVRQSNSAKEAQAVALPPEILLSPTAFTLGPNPISKSVGLVNFFRVGNQVKSAALKVYDASGKAICRIDIKDADQSKKRQVGSWNLKDARGRPVPEGTYLVKGTLKTVDRKSEKIVLLIGVR